jgi:hypothetical protein
VPLAMKFLGTLSDEGVQLLEKSIIPACQRAGKRAFLLLSRETVSFVQDENESNGMLILARVKTGQLFDLTSFLCTSRTDDCICVRVSLDVLLKALRSASAHGADGVDVSLKYRPLKAVPGGSPVPLIELRWRNDTISIEQEIPIEKPCVGPEVRRIHDISVKISTESPPCDFYVDLDPMELKPVVGILDSVRGFAKRVVVSLTRRGDFCLVAQAGMSMIGVRFPMLNVYKRDGTRMAGAAGPGQSAEVEVPQLIQALKSIQVTSPTIILCGISEAGDFFHVIPSHKKDALGCTEGVAPFAFDFRLPICRED